MATEFVRSAPNLNHLWARLLVEELVRNGVTRFFVGPGSRSTPLAVAVAGHPRAEVTVHVDERGGAFAALGAARASGHPAAWVTTSGTAVANGLPAAVEADAAAVPLLLLTADRPPELRETGANQTIRQPPLFASVARWAFDFPVPSAEIDPAFVLSTAAHAVARALGPPAGPVHLNLPFREPLAPVPDGTDVSALLGPLGRRLDSARPYAESVSAPGVPEAEAVRRLAERLGEVERGIVTAGPMDARTAASARVLAERLGWPLLPDVLSSARLGPSGEAGPGAVPFYDLALASPAFAEAYRPEAVVHVGARMTSKRLQQHVEAARPDPYAVAHDGPGRLDPAHRVTHRLQGAPGAEALAQAVAPRAAGGWLRGWQRASDAVAAVFDAAFADDALAEPRVARMVTARAPEGAALIAAASMPVRDLDAFAAPGGARLRVTANRGASGIDGTVSTAAGFARAFAPNGPVVLFLGDLALLHDLNGLALLRSGPPVVVVVVNNDGGGIFHFLPVAPGEGRGALTAEVFEPMFGTPHGLGFEHAARMFGLPYARPTTASAFEADFREAVASGRSALIEVRTNRAENAALHRNLQDRCARAVEAALGL